jgi:acyl-[acyl carrier protein]--UDP-N-acetylglucosamine O-acyltransferase
MRRLGLGDAEVEAMKTCYKRLFRERGGSILEKVAALRNEFAEFSSVQTLCDAVLESAGGVHGRAQENLRGDDKRGSRVAPAPARPEA